MLTREENNREKNGERVIFVQVSREKEEGEGEETGRMVRVNMISTRVYENEMSSLPTLKSMSRSFVAFERVCVSYFVHSLFTLFPHSLKTQNQVATSKSLITGYFTVFFFFFFIFFFRLALIFLFMASKTIP